MSTTADSRIVFCCLEAWAAHHPAELKTQRNKDTSLLERMIGAYFITPEEI
jgi:hypothetical protein